ncbi:MAG: SurA N-terminal domain-containing protein [Candidatus Omnitrophica bacterium]|nr:SurA N-terminal domain-containing protein [Candidatus Omnitrophota bacterium]
MLKLLRNKKTAKMIWIGLALIIVPAFVFWGFGSATRSSSKENVAGSLYGRNIPMEEYQKALEATKNQAIIQFGDKFQEVQKYINFDDQTWERLIMLSEVKRHGITASDKEIEELIASYPFFQKDGQFDNRTYQEMLQYVFHTQPRAFEEQARQNIEMGKLFTEITIGTKLDDNDIREEYRKASEEISVSFIAAILADLAKGIIPKDGELESYYLKDSLQFKQPLSFNIEYLTFDSEKKVLEAVKLLNSKSDMQKVAKDTGSTVKTTGLFAQNEPIAGIGWSPEILNLISKLKTAEHSQPIHLDNNYYILKLIERKESYIPAFDKIKTKVKDAYIKEICEKLAKEKMTECLKEAQEAYKLNPKSVDFVKIAKILGLKSGATQNFKFGSYIEGIGASDALWMAAQGLKTDEISDIVSIPTGLYILKLKNRTTIDEKKFQNDKENFSSKILQQKKQDFFIKYSQELKKKARPE